MLIEGQRLGDFEILEHLGQGGMGAVFKAQQLSLHRVVALKTLKPFVSDDPEYVARFHQEAECAAALNHPNLVQVYAAGVTDDIHYFAMEYVAGESAQARLERKGRLDPAEAIAICIHVATALDYGWRKAGLIHRDVKPENIFLSDDGEVKLGDLGLAKNATQNVHLTMSGASLGTSHYISPEQAEGKKDIDFRADIYSLGCTLYHLLCGQAPYGGESALAIMIEHVTRPVPDLRAEWPDCPAELSAVVSRMMQKQPADRPQSHEEAIAELRQAYDAVTVVDAHSDSLRTKKHAALPVRVRTASGLKKRGVPVAVLAGSGAGLLALAGALIYLAPWKGGPTARPERSTAPGSATGLAEVAAGPGTVSVPMTDVVLRFHGSNTIGAQLLPALLEKFLQKEGAAEIHRKPGQDHEEMVVEAHFPGEPVPKGIEISAHGSKTAFEDLAARKCDVGVASRPVKADEAEASARIGLGDLSSPACEHVLGLDGIAILVHRTNPVDTLSVEQIGDIFAGRITDWAQVGGAPGPIAVCTRDANSGTFDTFKALVLGSSPLVPAARRFEDSEDLSDAVSADPQAIGFVGLPFVRSAKVLAVSESGAAPFLANRFTVSTEDYPLARRLFLYTAASPAHPWIGRFVEFALGEEGQEVVGKAGFIKQTIDLQHPPIPSDAPAEYLRATQGADRLSLNLRFRKDGAELDNKSVRDMDRIAEFMGESTVAGKRLLLLGFSDNASPPVANVALSKGLAEAVGKQLSRRGIAPALVAGLGSALPIASNDTEAGRERNRRVEVWLK